MDDSYEVDPLVGQLVDGRWKLLERIGSGGFGVVYCAERIKLSKRVALKFLDERGMKSKEALARFEREARAISRVQHRHTVSILDFGVHEGRPYIVMEYLEGRSLSSEMGKPSMTPARGVHILMQMLEALRYAHQNGVVHRDLKPDNVMLVEMTGARDFVKLLDFGLARIISLDEPNISLPNVVAGTPSYMSPEQARGDRTDHRTDIYSAGVILYGMCTGKKPFRSEDAAQLLDMHKRMPPPSPRKVAPEKKISEALERVILRALEKKPDDRYLHAAAFLDALKATPEGSVPGAEEPRRSSRMLRLALAAALIAAGAAGALTARPYALERWAALRGAFDRLGGSSEATAPSVASAPPPAASATTASQVAPTNAPSTPAAAPANATPPTTAPTTAPTNAPAPMTAPTSAAATAPTNAPATAPTNAPPGATPPTAGPAVAAAAPSERAAAPTEKEPAPVEQAKTVAAASAPAPTAKKDEPEPARASDTQEDRVTALLDADKLADAERLLLAEQILHPRAGWVHLDLAEVYFRRLWRRDAEREWEAALGLDSSLRHDPRLLHRLCATLGKPWKGAGEHLIVTKVGADAVEPMTECIRTADDPDRVRAAARTIERVAGRSRVDRALVANRLSELHRPHP
jgi:serine/threonine-protein kinase